MSRSYEKIREEALALSIEERSWLAHDLFDSTRTREEREIAEAWVAEAERRLKEIEDGTAKTIPADETIARARAALKKSRRRPR